MAKTMLGIDIGAGDLKIVQWDGFKVTKAVLAQMPENMVKDGRIISYEAMSEFLKATMQEHKFNTKQCGVILPEGHVYLRRITMPAMTVSQLQVNLPYEFRDFLNMNKDKYFYDYIVNSIEYDDNNEPRQMDLTAAAVPKEIIEEYRAMFRRAGLRMVTAIPVECAYANLIQAVSSDESKEYCILDLGHNGTRLHMFTGSSFEATRLIDTGLSMVDLAIADTMDIDRHVARLYKQTNHNNVQQSEATMNVYGRIAVDVRRAVNFYAFNNQTSQLHHIWYCGGGSKIKPLLDVIGQSVEQSIHPISELLPSCDAANDILYALAPAVGVAMQGRDGV